MSERSREDILLASAVRFLIDGGDHAAALALLACQLVFEIDEYKNEWVDIQAPRKAYDVLDNQEHPIHLAVARAFAALGHNMLRLHAELIDIDPEWRKEMYEVARGQAVDNQGQLINEKKVIVWQNLRFRSSSEVKVAQELDNAGVAFWPLCMVRLGVGTRRNREADFLVCHKGKFGILEVDGEPFHPPSRTVEDHERDRLFKAYGILVIEHFDAGECWDNAEGVVKKFLAILEQAR